MDNKVKHCGKSHLSTISQCDVDLWYITFYFCYSVYNIVDDTTEKHHKSGVLENA